MELTQHKKAQTNSVLSLVGVILAIGVIAIMVGVFVYLLYALNTSMGGDVASGANGTTVRNVSQGLMPVINAILQVPGWLGLIVTVLIAGIVIMLVMAAFSYVRSRNE